MKLIFLIALLVSLAVTQSNGTISIPTCVQTVLCISTDYFDFITCSCLPYPPCGIRTCLPPYVLDPLACQCLPCIQMVSCISQDYWDPILCKCTPCLTARCLSTQYFDSTLCKCECKNPASCLPPNFFDLNLCSCQPCLIACKAPSILNTTTCQCQAC